MAKVKMNPVLERIRGKIGDLVFRRNYGQTSISSLPDASTRPPTLAQQEVQSRFQQAAAFGRSMLADPARRPRYEQLAKARNLPLFSVAIADYFNPPVVGEIDASAYHGQIGETIRVLASDDVEVVSVGVAIRGADNAIVEQGAATRLGDIWVYTATTAAPVGEPLTVEVTAKDRPANATVKTVLIAEPTP